MDYRGTSDEEALSKAEKSFLDMIEVDKRRTTHGDGGEEHKQEEEEVGGETR